MKKLILSLALTGFATACFAAGQTFDFKDPKGGNSVAFNTKAPLESISGTATNISGTITFDPADPASLKGKLIVEAKSLHVPNPTMKQHLHSATWIDVTKYPQITFEVISVANAKTATNVTTADVTGTFSLHGVSKQITVPVTITYLKDKLQERVSTLKGDYLVIRSDFSIKRGDFEINKGKNEDKVSDEIKLELRVAGQSPR